MDHQAAPGSLLRSFERHLRAQNRSQRTIGTYLESARLAESFLEGRGKQLEEATRADLEDFLGDILRRRSANTAATRYKVLRVLYRWLEEEEELSNPMTPTRLNSRPSSAPGPRGRWCCRNARCEARPCDLFRVRERTAVVGDLSCRPRRTTELRR